MKYTGDTAGGPADQYLYEQGIHATFMGKKLHLGATFSPGCGVVLLGRMDFFRYFREITFDQEGERFHVELAQDLDAARKAVGASLSAQAAAIKHWQEQLAQATSGS